MVYYLIQAYKKEVDETYKGHLHPSYVTSYYLEKGGKGFGLQSGMYDAVKFLSEETARDWREIAENAYPDREFDIVPVDGRLFGRVEPRYVINDGFVGNYGHSHGNTAKIANACEMHQVAYKPKTLDDILKKMEDK